LNGHFLHHHFLYHSYCEETSTTISLRQYICESVCIAKNGLHLKSAIATTFGVNSIYRII
jgi:hypothetical protein